MKIDYLYLLLVRTDMIFFIFLKRYILYYEILQVTLLIQYYCFCGFSLFTDLVIYGIDHERANIKIILMTGIKNRQ